MTMTLGDVVVDGSGCIGIIIDISEDKDDIKYKTVSFDGLPFYYVAKSYQLARLSDRFRTAWLKEMHRITQKKGLENG